MSGPCASRGNAALIDGPAGEPARVRLERFRRHGVAPRASFWARRQNARPRAPRRSTAHHLTRALRTPRQRVALPGPLSWSSRGRLADLAGLPPPTGADDEVRADVTEAVEIAAARHLEPRDAYRDSATQATSCRTRDTARRVRSRNDPARRSGPLSTPPIADIAQ